MLPCLLEESSRILSILLRILHGFHEQCLKMALSESLTEKVFRASVDSSFDAQSRELSIALHSIACSPEFTGELNMFNNQKTNFNMFTSV